MSFLIEPTPQGNDLVLTGAWSSGARRALEDGRADGLVLNYARGFPHNGIEFIEGLPLRRLNVLARSVTDLTTVYSLAPSLVELRVQSDPGATIELERLPLLRTLAASWPQIRGSIMFAQSLEHLAVPSYTETDLHALTALTSLVSLEMKERPKLRSLDGVEAFPWLAHLGIHIARHLQDINGLGRAASPVMESLRLTSCKSVVDITPVAACPSLRFFEHSDAGEIASVDALAGLDALERLYLFGSTRVVDGSLEPIAKLPHLRDFRMVNRPNYRPSTIEIEKAIAARQ